ncbi:FkbM family methyltransferase [Novipirellula sp. SH528]|uniref:FkbM family methyltransferase n=1 Tax=Novipirellula sp. SH528 TaxID=3454466 RepID=UPI003FA0BACC
MSASDNIGGQIVALGLYDLVVSETLWRLCDQGELALDVGANIGYTSFVMSQKLGSGTIWAYEPHPILFQELAGNVASLVNQGASTDIQTKNLALGPIAGHLPLHVPKDFQYHRGESSLAMPSHLEYQERDISVEVATLDSELNSGEVLGVMKIDVEGFELEVLQGGIKSFENKRIRDCVFEEHREYPTPVTEWFESKGYKVFRIDRTLRGPVMLPPDSKQPTTQWTAKNLLATCDVSRAEDRFHKLGWQCLKA